MFGNFVRSKSVLTVASAAALASVLLAPAAIAGEFSAGNSKEIPLYNSRAYYSAETPAQVAPIRRAPVTEPSVIERSSSNPATDCDHGYRWEETAANGWTLPMRCGS